MNRPYFEIDITGLRPGQRAAVDTIVSRVRERKTHTAIVLPTRYGKSDVIRVSSLWLWRDALASQSLVVVPNTVLRKQMVRGESWEEARNRYHWDIPVPLYQVDRAPKTPFPPHNAIVTAITTQMLSMHKTFFADWVDHEIRRSGIPPVVYIDEAHTGSESNQWGDSIQALSAAGAYVVLLTATPYRSDNKRIPGFEDILEEEKTTPVSVARRRVDESTGEILVDIYEGQRHFYRLKAHHETKFRQAWDEESPSPLCKVTRRTFAIDLTKFFQNREDVSDARLAELNERDSRRALMPALKDRGVIREACEVLVHEIHSRQADAPETAAIVFVGNDEQGDTELNRHARDVQEAIRVIDPRLVTFIATASDGDKATGQIDDFANGKGDVLIVKQMASVGIDIKRLKVALDLSNVRTAPAFVQRMTRICTVWDRGQSPDDHVRTAVYICPDDIRGTALYQRFIIDEGGEATLAELEYSHSVVPSDTTESDDPMYVPKGVSLPDTYADSDQRQAPGTSLPVVGQLLDFLPELARTRTHPELAAIIDKGNIRIDVTEARTRNMNQEEEDLISRVNDAADKIIKKEVKAALGRPYRSGDGPVWGRVSIGVWNRHKKRVGVSPGTELRDIHDLEKLEQMLLNMTRDYRGVANVS